MSLWSSIEGVVNIKLICADIEAALKEITQMGVIIKLITKENELTCRLQLRRYDYDRIQELCERKGYAVQVMSQEGIFWTFNSFLSHKTAVLGITILFILVLLLPSRILFVQVEGNSNIPTRKILAAADSCGIHFGASRRKVRSEIIKNKLLTMIPELKWAGINTNGCTAVISVKEKNMEPEKEVPKGPVCNVVAMQDGVIENCTVSSGTLICRPGQAVTKGQVLISGYTDCGICIQASEAYGEITALTNHILEAITPSTFVLRSDKRSSSKRYSLKIGKKRINLWVGSGISDTTCGRMYQEYNLMLPGGLSLPISLIKNEYTFFGAGAKNLDGDAAKEMLRAFSSDYQTDHMISGEILQKEDVFLREGSVFRLMTAFNCREVIGALQWEQDGEHYGKKR